MLVGMKHKHKACTRTNNKIYATAVYPSTSNMETDLLAILFKLFNETIFRLLDEMVHLTKCHSTKCHTSAQTDYQKYAAAVFFVRMEDIKTLTQAQASASWYQTQAQSMYYLDK